MKVKHGVPAGLVLVVAMAVGGWRAGSDRVWGEADPLPCSSSEPASPLPIDTSTDLRLVVNVPAYRLDVLEHDTVTRSIRLAVGQPKYRTPLGHFRMDYVVWNPWWRPPASEWARRERPQPPGWANPVGRVKLHVTGLVFLHGTPLEHSLGAAASHACMRMSNADAIQLARLVYSHAGPPTPPGLIDALIADTSRTYTLTLSRAVPVDIEYRLAEVEDDALVLHLDVYKYAGTRVPSVEEQAMQVLRWARGDSVTIDVERLRALVRTAKRAPARLSLDSLARPHPGPDSDSRHDVW